MSKEEAKDIILILPIIDKDLRLHKFSQRHLKQRSKQETVNHSQKRE